MRRLAKTMAVCATLGLVPILGSSQAHSWDQFDLGTLLENQSNIHLASSCRVSPKYPRGKKMVVTGKRIGKGMRITNVETAIIERNTFSNGRGYAIHVNPCTVKNVKINNNTFSGWKSTGNKAGGGGNAVIYLGDNYSKSGCRPTITINGNKFSNIKSKYLMSIKASNVTVKGNSASGTSAQIVIRMGDGNKLIGNRIAGDMRVYGSNHTVTGNTADEIWIGYGTSTQAKLCRKSGGSTAWPAAQNLTIENNKAKIKTQKFGSTRVSPSCRGNNCPFSGSFRSTTANNSSSRSAASSGGSGNVNVLKPSGSAKRRGTTAIWSNDGSKQFLVKVVKVSPRKTVFNKKVTAKTAKCTRSQCKLSLPTIPRGQHYVMVRSADSARAKYDRNTVNFK